ncbi:MAG TPA: FAD-dependent oxidoreductase, partial [Candidatus Limnocylindrales bacterium]|nr:FAD-dependent oxidoreductase [Candidatus Limnocylindrales bacterium]
MVYTPRLNELMKLVEENRPSRVGVNYPRMTADERRDVLRKFHPDYIEDGFRKIKVGVDCGVRMPTEMADVFESWSRLRDVEIDLNEEPDYDVDVLIIGGGGAGASAALEAHAAGSSLLLVTKLRFGDANTMMAQGGIQAADKENDTPAIHYLDVVGGGRLENIPELARALVMDAPLAIRWLEELGTMFDKQEDGAMISIHGGGTSRKRMHAARDYTGAEIMRTLRDEVLNKKIPVVEFCPAVELILDSKGRAAGAVLYNLETEQYLVARAKTVIIATGGSGRLHYRGFPTSNHYGATADGLIIGYRAGAKTIFADSIQYHPTGGAFPPQLLGLLVTEKTRALGATPLNIKGEQFVYHLETRDVESSAIIRECEERKLGITLPTGISAVWLDSPLIELTHGEGTVERQLPAMLRQFSRFGVDIRKDPMLIYPTLHYQNGGLLIDNNGQSTVENLYVAGEAAGGIHGTNRLMGNSLLDVIVFGRRAG